MKAFEQMVRESQLPEQSAKLDLTKSELLGSNSNTDKTFLEALAHSALYTLAQAPASAAAQLLDKSTAAVAETFGAKGSCLLPQVQWVSAPNEAEFGSKAWLGQQVGVAIGMTPWLAALHKGLGAGFCRGEMLLKGGLEAKLATGTQRAAASVAMKGVLGKELLISGLSGMAYGGLLTPTDPRESDFLSSRVKTGLALGATFATLTATAAGLKSMAQAKESGFLLAALKNDIVAGTISGIPAGLVSAEAGALAQGRLAASNNDYLKSMLGFSLVGGLLPAGQKALWRGSKAQPALELKAAESNKQTSLPVKAGASGLTSLELTAAGGEQSSANRLRQLSQRYATNSINAELPGNAELQTSEPLALSREQSALHRIIEHTVAPETMLVERHGASPDFTSLASYLESALQKETVPVRIYLVEGHSTLVVVPESYARQLDAVRAARHGGTALPHELEPLRFRALPEDFVSLLDRLPDSSLVHRLVLSNEANPLDAWHARQENDPSFKSAASADDASNVVFYQKDLDPFTQLELQHEWSHLLRKSRGRESFLFDLAARVEGKSPGLRERAGVNSDELWSVMLGENILAADARAPGSGSSSGSSGYSGSSSGYSGSSSGYSGSSGYSSRLEAIMKDAPIKTSILAEAIANHAYDNGLVLAEDVQHIVDRIQRDCRPAAVDALVRSATTSADLELAKTSARLLLHMGEVGRLDTATDPVSLTATFDQIGDQHVIGLAKVPLCELHLGNTAITNIEFLQPSHRQLRVLDLSGTTISTEQLAPLRRLSGLESLRLANISLNDGALKYLSSISSLKTLDLTNTRLSEKGLVDLRRRLPGCLIAGL